MSDVGGTNKRGLKCADVRLTNDGAMQSQVVNNRRCRRQTIDVRAIIHGSVTAVWRTWPRPVTNL